MPNEGLQHDFLLFRPIKKRDLLEKHCPAFKSTSHNLNPSLQSEYTAPKSLNGELA
ncbi:MAG: hypothetical protein OFPII_24630 [Osedax symbiont Rs1]|nr:MAG: hypothetical protein OFPII_24630 [Osedax symbiont Rs1]